MCLGLLSTDFCLRHYRICTLAGSSSPYWGSGAILNKKKKIERLFRRTKNVQKNLRCTNMRVLVSSIYILSQLCALFLNVHCEEIDTIDDVTSSTYNLRDIHSFFYMSEDEDLPSPTAEARKNEQSLSVAQPCNCREVDEQNTQEAIFYKRLIAILLSNLAMQNVDDRLIGTLSIQASSSEFEYLQNFVNGQGSIREVDRILVNVIKQSEYSTRHMATASYYFILLVNKASEHLMHYLSLMKEYWEITIISFTIIASFMILRRRRWSRGLVIFLIIDVMFITSFFITYWRLIQEAEIKLMAAQAQFAEMPIACQPNKMGIWDKMVASWFPTNDCEKYYETIMMNPRLQVTPAFALTYFLSSVIFQPLSYFGLVISEFVDNATGKLNFFSKPFVVFALFSSICVCIVLIPFSWIGGSINLGIGPFFKFGMKGRKSSSEKQERIERIYEEISPKKRLKGSEKMKQIIDQDNDPAGGDASTDMHHLRERHKKCICENKDGHGDVKCEKEKEDSDC